MAEKAGEGVHKVMKCDGKVTVIVRAVLFNYASICYALDSKINTCTQGCNGAEKVPICLCYFKSGSLCSHSRKQNAKQLDGMIMEK